MLSAYLDLSSEVSSFLSSVFSSSLDSPSVSPSAPSIVSPSTHSPVSSSGSGSISIVGGTRVATTKSLSVIVGFTPSGNSILLILIVSPISLLTKSNCNLAGMLFAFHVSSTNLLTRFYTPPCLRPGQIS